MGYSFPGQQNYISYLTDGQTSVQSSVAPTVNSVTVRIYVAWDDEAATQTLNDVQDTQIALNSGNAEVTVNVLFEQLVN